MSMPTPPSSELTRDRLIDALRTLQMARDLVAGSSTLVRTARSAGIGPSEIARESGLSRTGIWKTLTREEYMLRVSRFLEVQPGATTNAVMRGVTGKTEALQGALRALISEGYVRADQDGQALHLHLVRPFVAPPDSAQDQPPASDATVESPADRP